MIRIEALIHSGANLTSGDYIVYATYDQGSTKKLIPILGITLFDQIDNFLNQYGNAIIPFGIAVYCRSIHKKETKA